MVQESRQGYCVIRVGFSLIGGGFGTGGYNYLLNLVRLICEFESERVQPVLLFGSDVSHSELEPFAAIEGAEVVQSSVMNRGRRASLLIRALLLGRDPSFQLLLNDQRIDLIFESAHYFGWRVGRPVVAWIPDFQHRRLRSMFAWRSYWKRELGFHVQLSSGRLIMLSSNDARRDCELFYPTSKGRVNVVHFAVPSGDVPTLAESRRVAESYGLPCDFVFMPNQFWRHKNHDLVLDSLAQLRAMGRVLVVVSTGKLDDEQNSAHVERLMKRRHLMKLEGQLRVLGLIPFAHVRALLRASMALLNPSLFEGWSTPVEEARTLGMPMVLSDLAVHHEQVGDHAIYFDRFSAASLAEALAGLSAISDDEREYRLISAQVDVQRRVKAFASDFATLASDAVGKQSFR